MKIKSVKIEDGMGFLPVTVHDSVPMGPYTVFCCTWDDAENDNPPFLLMVDDCGWYVTGGGQLTKVEVIEEKEN